MKETLVRWQDIIGKAKTKRIAEILYKKKVGEEFNNHFIYTGVNSVVYALESIGKPLFEMDFLSLPEKREMILVFAEDLITKSLSDEFADSLSEILKMEFEEERWLDDEIGEIKKLLEDMEEERRFE